MSTATIDAPTAPKCRRKARPAYTLAMKRWSDAIDALEAAAHAAALLSDSLDDLLPDELDKCGGDNLREDAFHFSWSAKRHAEILDSSCPAEVFMLRYRPVPSTTTH